MTNAGSLMMGAHYVFLPWGPKGSQSAPVYPEPKVQDRGSELVAPKVALCHEGQKCTKYLYQQQKKGSSQNAPFTQFAPATLKSFRNP